MYESKLIQLLIFPLKFELLYNKNNWIKQKIELKYSYIN